MAATQSDTRSFDRSFCGRVGVVWTNRCVDDDEDDEEEEDDR